MTNMKPAKTYFFTVEGETEKWYLEWLQNQINTCEEASHKVVFDCQIQKNPLKRAKALTVTTKTILYHLSDYESDEPIHVQNFIATMDNMKEVLKMGKEIKCQFGYSNLTFDLWIILLNIFLYLSGACRETVTARRKFLTRCSTSYRKATL